MNRMPEANKIKKITVDRNLCIGAASCVVAAGTVFELDAENKAVIKQKGVNPVRSSPAEVLRTRVRDASETSNGVKNSGPAEREALENTAIDDTTLMQAASSCPTKAIFLYGGDGKQIYP